MASSGRAHTPDMQCSTAAICYMRKRVCNDVFCPGSKQDFGCSHGLVISVILRTDLMQPDKAAVVSSVQYTTKSLFIFSG